MINVGPKLVSTLFLHGTAMGGPLVHGLRLERTIQPPERKPTIGRSQGAWLGRVT